MVRQSSERHRGKKSSKLGRYKPPEYRKSVKIKSENKPIRHDKNLGGENRNKCLPRVGTC